MEKPSQSATLLVFFQKNPDTYHPIPYVCDATGLTRAEVASAVQSLVKQGYPISRPARGTYLWSSKPQAVPEQQPTHAQNKALVFTFLGDTNKGMLLRGEDSKLYLAKEVTL